ncbi:MAG: SIMPL domain-containing protein [Phyllobacteriaceae bacterium]|nr:SIMPL domain-containing protein [Phyllobacteriaceae bacterium]
MPPPGRVFVGDRAIVLTVPFRAFLFGPALAGAVAIGIAAFAPQAVAQTFDTRAIINVSATGDAALAPDIAYLNLSVLREAPTARDALTANSAAMAEVLAAMKAFGIEDRDLQTTGFSINPQYVYPKPEEPQTPPKIVGYQVQNGLSVRVRDLSKLGEVLDRAVTLGVNSGGNVTFGNDNPDAALESARVTAMKNAVGKAKLLVEAAGAKLGKIVSITENYDRPFPQPMMAKAAMDMAAAPESVPVAAGENTYSVTVNVAFEISQ